ncbi:beta strand repeat-containing protein [Bathymodiolus thermophilus thioautotrophic gill symbiont]|uniref:Bacterial Ig-like domain-containing protein n=1 Tax=Bathymodiolus thermophilus thioautotrophic gill symbiont TaxID=2360 RepID=A0A8H8XFL1_9GAMM|nr:Ig-like domain-containing protein [Bathymodiolus thermophilus thioautotrophic gill symbiont]CAB5501966.1 hypothetical protein THERMOS_1491 [Bathymodiolus thermophilus thioautotrophic gill symbiont]
MQVKTQKQIKTLQTKAKNVANKLNKEAVVVTEGVQHIQVQAGVSYQLNFENFDTKKPSLIAKKIGDDLEVTLEDSTIIFDNYFNVCAADLACLVSLPTESGGLYYIVADVFFTLEGGTQVVYFYGEQSIVFTESGAVSTSTQSFYDTVTSNIAGVIAFLAIMIASNNGGNDDGDSANTVIAGTISAGKYIDGGTNDSIKVYKADGTGTLIGSSALNENGQYTIILTGDNADYIGAVYVKLTKSDIRHVDELNGREVLDSDLFAVAYISSGENTIDISVRSSVVAKILGVDKTTTTIALSATDINKWNEKVNASFDLLGSAINTDIDTINSSGDESNAQAEQAGQVAAALSGMRNTPATNTFEKVIEKMADIIASTGALNKTAFDALIIGAIAVKAKAEADKIITEADVDNAEKALKTAQDAVDAAGDNATTAQKQALDAAQKAYDQAVAKNLEAQNFIKMAIETIDRFNSLQIAVSDITITSDTGAADFITNDDTLVIGATLDDALSGGKKLWGSVDGGKTWTDISATGTNIVWSNDNKTVAWSQTFTKNTNSSIQFVITKTIITTTATAEKIMADKDGGIARHDYIYDGIAPTEATIAIKSGESNLVGADKVAHLEVTYDNITTGDVIQLQKGGDNKTDLGSVYTVTSLDVENGKATIAIQQTDLSTLSADNILVSVKSITDLAGNVNNIASADQIFKVDTIAPVITAFSAAPGAYKEGAEISLTATVSESVKVGAKITITLNTGTAVELTAAVEGTTLTGTYTVEASQNNNNLSVDSFAIDNSMPPTDIAGNAMTAVVITNNIATGVIIDTIDPIFTSSEKGVGAVGQDIAVYDANVSNGDDNVEYTINSDKFNIDKDTGVVTYKVTPTTVTTEADNIVITATDAAGNAKTHEVAITIVDRPVITITSDKPDGTNGAFTLTFAFTEAVSGFELTDIDFGDADANLIKGTLTPTTANKVFTLTVTPKDALENSNITVNIADGMATGQTSGRSNIAAFEFIQKFDETPPEVNITSSALTNDATPEISGTAEVDAAIRVIVAGATYTTVATNGNWSIDTNTVPDSGTLTLVIDNAVLVIATDAAGNTSNDIQTLKIDTVAPSLTTQVNAILNSESDLTISFNENIKTQGGNVEIWNANSKVETIAISNSDINGNILTINPTNDLPEGSFYLKMASGVITDMAGNDAAAITKDNNQWAFEVKALSTSINLTGVSSTDTYINASEKSNAVLSGDLIGAQATVDKIEFYTVTANDVLTLVPDLTITNVVVNSNKHWSQNLSNIEFVDGVTYKARIYLKSGNTEINQYSDAITFDTSPATLTINAVSTDDKINLSDKNASIVISGTSDAIGQTVTVSWDNGTEKTVVVDDNGDWSLTYTANEVPADNATSKITARVSDVAGNPETLIEHSIIIDTVATAKPVIGFATGEDKYINATETSVNLEISSTEMVAGDTIQLKKDGVNFNAAHTVTTIEVNAGKATINIAKSDLGSNDNTVAITAVITDVTGNTSAISDVQNIVLDAINPTLTDVVLVGDANKTAAEAMANVLSFTAETGSTVEVVFTGTNGTITRNIASASGTAESIALVANDLTTLGEGAISVQTTVTDKAGNTTISNAGNFVLDTQGPTAPTNLSLADVDNTGSNDPIILLRKPVL